MRREVLIEQDNDIDAFYKAYDSARKRHLQTLLGKVNFDALRSKATQIRDGISCYIPALPNGMGKAPEDLAESEQVINQTGGQNCKGYVCFIALKGAVTQSFPCMISMACTAEQAMRYLVMFTSPTLNYSTIPSIYEFARAY